VPNSTTRTPVYGHVVQHHQWTSSQQFYNLLYNKFTTKGTKICHIPASWHVEMLGSGIAMWQICCTTSCRIVVSSSIGGVVQHVRIAGVRVVEFGTKKTAWARQQGTMSLLVTLHFAVMRCCSSPQPSHLPFYAQISFMNKLNRCMYVVQPCNKLSRLRRCHGLKSRGPNRWVCALS